MPRLSIFRPTNLDADGIAPAGIAEGWNEPMDYCGRCYPNLRGAMAAWGVPAWMVDMHTEHPDYRLDQYECESCHRQLDAWDN